MNQMDTNEALLNYYELILYHDRLDSIPEYELPEGFRFTSYSGPKSRESWLNIEESAGEFLWPGEGEAAWDQYYGGKEEALDGRMFFIETASGEKVATATAYYGSWDQTETGWLHWVAVRRDFQGQGLSRPLISRALMRLRQLGCKSIRIPTQTNTWLALKIYLDFGFRPLPENAADSRFGYSMMRTVTNHPALSSFPPAEEKDLWDPRMCALSRQLRDRFPDLIGFKAWKEKGNLLCFRRPEGVFSTTYVWKDHHLQIRFEQAEKIWP